MKTWMVILAALVIFVAGAVTGGMVMRQAKAPTVPAPVKAPERPPSPWWIQRPEFLGRMKSELQLTETQSRNIDDIMRKSRQRTDLLWEALREPLQEEMTQVKDSIRNTLTAEQQTKFDELLKPKPWSGHSGRWTGGGRKPGEDKPKFPGGEPPQRPDGPPNPPQR